MISITHRTLVLGVVLLASLIVPSNFVDFVVLGQVALVGFFSAKAIRPHDFTRVAALGWWCVVVTEAHAGHWARLCVETVAPLGVWRVLHG